jgi:DNA mismatch repair protein MutL
VALWGLAGLPSIARGSSKHLHVFVNGRPIRDRTIQHAAVEAYRGLIEPSRYPTVLLMLELSAAGVDVNVHPQKSEVRFRDSSLIHSVVLRAIREALRRADLTPAYSMIAASAARQGMMAAGPGTDMPADLPGTGLTSQPSHGPVADGSLDLFVERLRTPPVATNGPVARLDYDVMKRTMDAAPLEEPKPAPRILQVHNSFLVTQDEQGVVIIDQHALHERVMFEYLLGRVMGQGLAKQRLLAPATVQTTAAQLERLPAMQPLLERIGVEAEPSGPATVAVHAFPSFLFDRGVDPVTFMLELFDKAERTPLLADIRRGGEQAMRDVLDMMSCKAAVKAGDRLSDVELEELMKLRAQVERSSNCPHGRPTSIRLTIRELEKLFGRS